MSKDCQTCRHHGPPVSELTEPRPCAECVPYAGCPKHEPVEEKKEEKHP